MFGRSLRRIGLLVAVCLALVGVFGGGWWAAGRFQSPAQREAAAAPPAAGPIFNPAVAGALTDQISGSGTVVYSSVSGVSVVSLPPNPVATDAPIAVGQSVYPGDVVAEINSRPVFIFPGEFDFHRDLVPGLVGRDVAQLQNGLRAAGYRIGASEDSSYGPQTAAAVAGLYRGADYPGWQAEGDQASGAPAQQQPVQQPAPDAAAPAPAPAAVFGIPLSELAVATAGLPAMVVAAPAVGDHPAAGQPLVSIAHGGLVVSIQVDAGAFVKLKPGMRAAATITGAAGALAGQVQSLIEPPAPGAGQSIGSQQPPTVIVSADSPIDQALAGKAAVVVVTIEVVAADSLLVPCRAVATGADQASRVLRKRPGEAGGAGEAAAAPVAVTRLGSLAGVCAVSPSEPGALLAGDLVQVG